MSRLESEPGIQGQESRPALDLSRAKANLENGLLNVVVPQLEERRSELRMANIQEIEEFGV